MRLPIVWCFSAYAVHDSFSLAHQSGACSSDDSSDDACEAARSAQNALLQVQSRRFEVANEQALREDVDQEDWAFGEPREDYVWKSKRRANPALHYFKWWADGKVRNNIRSLILVSSDTSVSANQTALLQAAPARTKAFRTNQARHEMSATGLGEMLVKHKNEYCPRASSPGADWRIHDTGTDKDGVHHTLLRTPEGKMQYVAVHSNKVVAADPEVCTKQDLSFAQQPDELPPEEEEAAEGEPELLDIESDPLVQDCVKLFHRTAMENCKRDFDIRVLSATLHIIDGFAVNANVELTGSKVTYHHIECDFETPQTPDASLLQDKAHKSGGHGKFNGTKHSKHRHDNPDDELLEEEKDGLEATLRMTVDICSADQESSSEEDDLELLAKYSFGHLPAYKGYGHLEDEEYKNIPVFLTQRDSAPSSYNLRSLHPTCFPDQGREVIRNQGTCGSCWAFASASALMTNLCVSGGGRHAMASPTDRFEVSVQGIMSCQSRGCNGGNAQSADTALKKYGIGKERDFAYRCGGGRAENHFSVPSVKCTSSNSWGASCQFNPNRMWTWGGIARAGSGGWRRNAGEAAIMKTLVECGSGYINFKVYANFMKYKSGIYSSISGGKRGGHAVTLLGYGTQRGVKYWHIANSWGTKWGNNGYVDFKRGTNLAEIESSYYCMKGTVGAGGSVPPPAPPAPAAPRPAPRPSPGSGSPRPSPRPRPAPGSGSPRPSPRPRPPPPPPPRPSPGGGVQSSTIEKIEADVQKALQGIEAIKPSLEAAKQELGKLKQTPSMRDAPSQPSPPPPPPPPRVPSGGSGSPSPARRPGSAPSPGASSRPGSGASRSRRRFVPSAARSRRRFVPSAARSRRRFRR